MDANFTTVLGCNITFPIRRSKWLIITQLAVHLLACLFAFMTYIYFALSLWIFSGLLVICCLSYCFILGLHALRYFPVAIVLLELDSLTNCFKLQNKRGDNFLVDLCPDSVLTTRFMLLNFKLRIKPWFRRTVIIMPDMLNKQEYRKLQLCIKRICRMQGCNG